MNVHEGVTEASLGVQLRSHCWMMRAYHLSDKTLPNLIKSFDWMQCRHLSNCSTDYNLDISEKKIAPVTQGGFYYITKFWALFEEISEKSSIFSHADCNCMITQKKQQKKTLPGHLSHHPPWTFPWRIPSSHDFVAGQSRTEAEGGWRNPWNSEGSARSRAVSKITHYGATSTSGSFF